MMRSLRPACAVLAVVGALALVACAAPEPASSPTPTAAPAAASALRCLADHSPWTLDLEAAFAAWYRDADGEHVPTGGDVTGTAQMTFTRGAEPEWGFTATGVDFELYFEDGSRESSTTSAELAASYLIIDDAEAFELVRVRMITPAPTGSASPGDDASTDQSRIAAPAFPWVDGETEFAFSCTEHRLVISDPDSTPSAWTFLPGG
jgi:hypothetical protein